MQLRADKEWLRFMRSEFLNVSPHSWDHRVIQEVEGGLALASCPCSVNSRVQPGCLGLDPAHALQTSKGGNGKSSPHKLLLCS